MLDPLDVFLTDRTTARGMVPIPLVSTDYEVEIVAGLAVVTCHRLFRNAEDWPIEAVMTFPAPLKATLFSLTANIDGRNLKAIAETSLKAREAYENAVGRGRSAVLHEELLRGIHMVAVANLGPGCQIMLSASWVLPLTIAGSRAHLRIPQSVGDVYGRSPLPDAVALVTGGPAQPVMIEVRTDTPYEIVGAPAHQHRATIANNAPIDIVTELWSLSALRGVAASGRAVQLSLSPSKAPEGPLDVAILLDRSGSMGEAASTNRDLSSHQAGRAGLHSLVASLSKDDRIEFWEFSNLPRCVGRTDDAVSRSPAEHHAALHEILTRFGSPAGGTEIGFAITGVVAASEVGDLLVLTDGRSNALKVEWLARLGRRISVVLIGADSLEARIGHLAALTGGDVFVATGSDLTQTIQAATERLRGASSALPELTELPEVLECDRDGLHLHAIWSDSTDRPSSDLLGRAVVAASTTMLISCVPAELGAELACSEGLVTHLTSLVMVDEEGETFGGLPTTRKVELAAVGGGIRASDIALQGGFYVERSVISPEDGLDYPSAERFSKVSASYRLLEGANSKNVMARLQLQRRISETISEPAVEDERAPPPSSAEVRSSAPGETEVEQSTRPRTQLDWLKFTANQINWLADEEALRGGDLSVLTRDIVIVVEAIADLDVTQSIASRGFVSPLALSLAFLASLISETNDEAERLANGVLNGLPSAALARLGGEIIAAMQSGDVKGFVGWWLGNLPHE